MSLYVLLFALAAETQPAATDAAVEAELTAALAADAADAAAAAPRTMTALPATGALSNPEISAIATFTALARRDEELEPSFQAGDDPGGQGLALQELELTFASDVDPYFRMRAFLAIGAESIEVEEAYLETTRLPGSLLFRGGTFRSGVGRNNEQHLHTQDFARRPKTTLLLGEDGLRGPAAQLSWLTPLPWYATLGVEVMSLDPDRPSATANVEQFFELSTSWSLLLGTWGAYLQRPPEEPMDGMPPPPDPTPEFVVGTDVYVKWRPPNVVETYAWVALSVESLAMRPDDRADWEGVHSAQFVAQVARRVRIAVRGDLVGYPRTTLARELDASVSLAFQPSEFSRVRLTYVHDHPIDDGLDPQDTIFLQLEGAIGAHGAHPF